MNMNVYMIRRLFNNVTGLFTPQIELVDLLILCDALKYSINLQKNKIWR